MSKRHAIYQVADYEPIVSSAHESRATCARITRVS